MALASLAVAEDDYKSPATSASSPLPQQQNKNPKVALKAFLQRAHFDLGFTLNAASPPWRQTPAAQPAPLAVKAATASPPSNAIDEAIGDVSSAAPSPLVLTSSTPSDIPSPQLLSSKEHNLPVHLISLTLRSTSLKSAPTCNDMAGLERSKWASPQAKATQQLKSKQPLNASAPPFNQPLFTSTTPFAKQPVPPADISRAFASQSDPEPVATYSQGTPHHQSKIATTDDPHTSTSTEGLLKAERAAERAATLAKIKENANPARSGSSAERIAKLLSKRNHSSDFESKKVEVKVDPADSDNKAGLLSAAFAADKVAKEKAEAERVKVARIKAERVEAERVEAERVEAERVEAERREAERVEAERREAKRIENERAAKAKAEAERRAKIQSDLDAVTAKIAELEKLEEERLAEMTAEIDAVEAEVRNAKDCQACLNSDRLEVLKLRELAIHDRDGAQLRIDCLTEKADELDKDYEEATDILMDGVNSAKVLQEYDAVSAAKYKQDTAVLLQDKARLEYTLDHPEGLPPPPKVDTSSWPITGYITPRLDAQPDDGVDVPVVFDDAVPLQPTPSATAPKDPSLVLAAPKDPSLVSAAPKDPSLIFAAPKPESVDHDVASTNGHAKETNGVANGATGHNNVVPTLNGGWPKPKPRAPSQVRKVVLHNLPEKGINVTQIMRLVFHGQIHAIDYHSGSKSATIIFLQFADCKKYLDATGNGIPWPEDPSRVIMVEPCDFESGDQEKYDITKAHGMTRCVRMADIEPDWTSLALRRIAEGTDRQLERMINGHDSKGRRIAEFRFMSIPMAFQFKKEMERSSEFSDSKVIFVTDPCEATGIHSATSMV